MRASVRASVRVRVCVSSAQVTQRNTNTGIRTELDLTRVGPEQSSSGLMEIIIKSCFSQSQELFFPQRQERTKSLLAF